MTSPLVADLDHAATSRLRPEVVAAMEPYLGEAYGNPSGAHQLARQALRAVDEAHERVAAAVGCGPGEVVFTSGGTEADNHAISGGMPPRAGVPLCSAVEHGAVLNPVGALGGRTISVDRLGRVDLDDLSRSLQDLRGRVSVVSVILSNNEVGTINDLGPVAEAMAEHAPGVPLHTDAVQAAAWLDLPTAAGPADLISVSGHKLGGPKGVGALVARTTTDIAPLLRGGGQERGRRAGSLNVAGIVGLAEALDRTVAERNTTNARVALLRDRLADRLVAAVPGVSETVVPDGDRRHLVPGICHLSIDGVDSETLLYLLDAKDVLASAASSCASGAHEDSHVIAALGIATEGDSAALRLSLGWCSTDTEVDRALAVVPEAIERVRMFSTAGV